MTARTPPTPMDRGDRPYATDAHQLSQSTDSASIQTTPLCTYPRVQSKWSSPVAFADTRDEPQAVRRPTGSRAAHEDQAATLLPPTTSLPGMTKRPGKRRP